MRGKSLMLQGTGSGVGKSLLCAAFLRIFTQDGLHAAPFKAQNMALNSYVTRDGLEMGRAQVLQAQAARVEPEIAMNPVLLKPTGDRRSQVIVNGKPAGTMSAAEYQEKKPALRSQIRDIYNELESRFDAVVLEGAGSPAEINLRNGDIVNMSMAEAADAPVLLVGDINLGGVFASLLGTVMLLEPEERARVKGVLINKFRGDVRILEPGLRMLEERIGIPVLGVIPWMDLDLEDEDSVADRLDEVRGTGEIDIAVVRLPHLSNFTDFQALTLRKDVRVRYASTAKELEGADLILLPGTKNTIDDLLDLRRKGMDAAIVRHARSGGMVIGVCGGYQMLGNVLRDPLHVEASVPETSGLGLLDMEVEFAAEKTTCRTRAEIRCRSGWLSALDGVLLDGYEIHAGKNTLAEDAQPWMFSGEVAVGARNAAGNVLGSYVHGMFDDGILLSAVCDELRRKKGLTAENLPVLTMEQVRERELDRLADVVRASVDMDKVYAILRGEL